MQVEGASPGNGDITDVKITGPGVSYEKLPGSRRFHIRDFHALKRDRN